MVTCGIDWAQDHHDIAIVDAEGRRVAKRRIPESVAGLTELTAMLAEAGDDPKDPIPVAIEIPRGLLVAALRASGRPIYPINPMSVARYRERSRWQRSTRCVPAPSRPTRCRARSPTTVMPSRWPTSCAPTPTSIAGCPPTPRNRSPCWPGRIRTPPGGAAGPVTNCCRCCESTFRVSWRLSPSAPAESPHPKPEQEEDRGESWGIGIASPRFPVGRQPLSITVKFVALTDDSRTTSSATCATIRQREQRRSGVRGLRPSLPSGATALFIVGRRVGGQLLR